MPSPTPDAQPSFDGMTPKEQREAFKASRLRWIEEQREKLRMSEESHPAT